MAGAVIALGVVIVVFIQSANAALSAMSFAQISTVSPIPTPIVASALPRSSDPRVNSKTNPTRNPAISQPRSRRTSALAPDGVWEEGDIIIGVGGGEYQVYSNDGTYKETINQLYNGDTTGCTFDSNADLYTTQFVHNRVIKFSGIDPHGTLQDINTGTPVTQGNTGPESIVFANNGDFFVGNAGTAGGNKRILRFNSNGDYQQEYSVQVERKGSDWIDLSSDQHTIFYTSEGNYIYRYDTATGTQLPPFVYIEGAQDAFALRLLPPGDGTTGGLIVADQGDIKRLDGHGRLVWSTGGSLEYTWFSLDLDPNGTSFWAVAHSSENFYEFDIDSGALLYTGTIGPNFGLGGICLLQTANQPTPTSTATNTPTSTPTPTPTMEPNPPLYTLSYYIQQNSPQAAMALGCNAREWGATGNAVLDFGGPRIISSDPPVFGTKLLFQQTNVTLDQIKTIVIQFAQGYANPTLCGDPPVSTPRSLTIIAAVSGTANSTVDPSGKQIWADNEVLNVDHGAAWALMVDSIYDTFLGKGWLPDIRIAGGHDSEYYGPMDVDCRDRSSGYRHPCDVPTPVPTPYNEAADEWTLYSVQDRINVGVVHWAEGFVDAESQGYHLNLYNFGSCEGCPRSGARTSWSASQLQTLDRTYHVSWELENAAAIPQIYYAPYAWEWYNVRWYSQAEKQDFMIIYGLMTECNSPSCLGSNLSTRLQMRFDLACRANRTPQCQDPNPAPNWNDYGCDNQSPCLLLAPSIAWQALSDMISSPNTPDGTPNPEVVPQLAISTGVTNIDKQR